jgi:hypothetical protein
MAFGRPWPARWRSRRSVKPDDGGLRIEGALATLRITIHFDQRHLEEAGQQAIYRHFLELREQMHEELKWATWNRLGDDFEVTVPTVKEGSVELLVIISAVGNLIASYGAVRAGIDYLLGDFANIAAGHVPTSNSYVLLPTLVLAPGITAPAAAPAAEQLLLRHVLTINLVMLLALTLTLFIALTAALD